MGRIGSSLSMENAEPDEATKKRKVSPGTKILIGVMIGVGVGLFLGEYSTPIKAMGDVYLALLQMTVLPYIVVSLISKIGGFTYEQAKQIGHYGLTVQAMLWAIALGFVVLLPFSLPSWEAGTFFTSSLVEEPAKFDFLDLYIPTNPFGSLANNVVPAAVVFSILVGIALIPLANKDRVLGPFEVIGDALGNIAHGVIRLAPYGTAAMTAGAVGISAPGEFIKLGGYLGTYTVGIVLLAFVLYPALVCSLTPIRYFELLARMRGTLGTAFATGKLFAVLPMIIEDVTALLVSRGLTQEEAEDTTNVLVPLAYPFPNAGKVLAIVFIPFAAWYIGTPLELKDYPLLISVGLLSFFGSPIVAIPFLLGLFRLPADLVALFIVAGLWGARFGDVLGVVHLSTFSLLTAARQHGWFRIQKRRALTWLIVSVVSIAGALWFNHAAVSWSLVDQEPPAHRVATMQPFFEEAAIEELQEAEPHPVPREGEESVLERIHRSGVLRAGIPPDSPPFAYRNDFGQIVGLEIDLLHRLASELEVELQLVPYEPGELDDEFSEDHFDLAVGGYASVIRNTTAYEESRPYIELHGAVVVPDHRVEDFRSERSIQRLNQLRIGYVEDGVMVRTGRHEIPDLEMVPLATAEEYLTGEVEDIDGLLTTAESGAIYTMMHPAFSVVVPEDMHARVPIVFAVAADPDLVSIVDRFLQIKRADGTVDELYQHWILGKDESSADKRWSVVKDVFGWGR